MSLRATLALIVSQNLTTYWKIKEYSLYQINVNNKKIIDTSTGCFNYILTHFTTHTHTHPLQLDFPISIRPMYTIINNEMSLNK